MRCRTEKSLTASRIKVQFFTRPAHSLVSRTVTEPTASHLLSELENEMLFVSVCDFTWKICFLSSTLEECIRIRQYPACYCHGKVVQHRNSVRIYFLLRTSHTLIHVRPSLFTTITIPGDLHKSLTSSLYVSNESWRKHSSNIWNGP
jgi:hypothetical protein